MEIPVCSSLAPSLRPRTEHSIIKSSYSFSSSSPSAKLSVSTSASSSYPDPSVAPLLNHAIKQYLSSTSLPHSKLRCRQSGCLNEQSMDADLPGLCLAHSIIQKSVKSLAQTQKSNKLPNFQQIRTSAAQTATSTSTTTATPGIGTGRGVRETRGGSISTFPSRGRNSSSESSSFSISDNQQSKVTIATLAAAGLTAFSLANKLIENEIPDPCTSSRLATLGVPSSSKSKSEIEEERKIPMFSSKEGQHQQQQHQQQPQQKNLIHPPVEEKLKQRRVTVAALTIGMEKGSFTSLLNQRQTANETQFASNIMQENTKGEKNLLPQLLSPTVDTALPPSAPLLLSSSFSSSSSSSVPHLSRPSVLSSVIIAPSHPLSAVEEQRLHVQTLISRAQLRPKVGSLSEHRRSSLLSLLTHSDRPTLSQLEKKQIRKNEVAVAELCHSWQEKENLLDKFMHKRPQVNVLEKKNIFLRESTVERATKLKEMLKFKPTPVLPVIPERNIINTIQEDETEEQIENEKNLKEKLSLDETPRPSSELPSLHRIQSAAHARTASSLISLLSLRPSSSSLLSKNLIHSAPNIAPQLAGMRIQIERAQIQSQLNQFLRDRPTMKDLRQMAKDLLLSHFQSNAASPRSSQVNKGSYNIEDHTIVSVDKVLSEMRRRQQIGLDNVSEECGDDDGPGGVWCLGKTKYLGIGNATNSKQEEQTEEYQTTPILLSSLAGNQVIVQLSCGATHTLARTRQGELLAWGTNHHGELGLGDYYYRNHPTCVQHRESVLLQERVTFVSCGPSTSIIVTASDAVYSWGNAKSGALGVDPFTLTSATSIQNTQYEIGVDRFIGPTAASFSISSSAAALPPSPSASPTNIAIPRRSAELSSVKIETLSLGVHHGAALTKSGVLYVWGLGEVGQLGFVDPVNRYEPVKFFSYDEFFADVSCGDNFTVAVGFDHYVYSWGSNQYGQLGYPITKENEREEDKEQEKEKLFQATPKVVMSLWRRGVEKVSAGKYQTIAKTEDGELYATVITNMATQNQLDTKNSITGEEKPSIPRFVRLSPRLNWRSAVTSCCPTSVASAARIVGVSKGGELYEWLNGSVNGSKYEFDELEGRAVHNIRFGNDFTLCIGNIRQKTLNLRGEEEELEPIRGDGEGERNN